MACSALDIKAWLIETQSEGPEERDFYENIFSQGNGYMGVRGYAPESPKRNSHERSVFLAGFFEYIKTGITDMVNQPDFSRSAIWLNGISAADLPKTNFRQSLDMRNGVLTRRYTVKDSADRMTGVEIIRFLSMDNPHLAGIRIKIRPLNFSGRIKIGTGIDGDTANLPVADDQLTENKDTVKFWETVKTWQDGGAGGLSALTKHSKRVSAMSYRISSPNIPGHAFSGETGDSYVGHAADFHAEEGCSYVVDKIVSVFSFRDAEDPEGASRRLLEGTAGDSGFDALLAKSGAAWEQRWAAADIVLDAEEELQGALRYSIFNLIQANSAEDSRVSIGARGLVHGRYKGCYFWDTEIFMLPFFLHTNPGAARNLLLYRANTLPDALQSAKRFGLAGARYSWMSSDTGYEQCESWDTGCCEIHITADVAYAAGRYLELTADDAFFRDYTAEILIQTARYWVSRFSYNAAAGEYNLLFVKGPDEYCGVTTNDFYTVEMARHNLSLAIEAVGRMKDEFPAQWSVLRKKTGFSDNEAGKWRDVLERSLVRHNAEQDLFIQDDTFELLEPLDMASVKDRGRPLYHQFPFDRLQRFQVLKQPNVLMAMALLPHRYTERQKSAAWNYYEPKTLHDSSLSFGVHALIAARLGLMEQALAYFRKACLLDLRDLMGNTAQEGLHTASFGITWQAMVFGFAGLWIDSRGVHCNPQLPEGIRGIQFYVRHKGRRHKITISSGGEAEIREAE
ncbi:MAG: hypothetical protein LBP80_04780 [Treponema sp.]|nr:hypothetical protein [Treponema sp.]